MRVSCAGWWLATSFQGAVQYYKTEINNKLAWYSFLICSEWKWMYLSHTVMIPILSSVLSRLNRLRIEDGRRSFLFTNSVMYEWDAYIFIIFIHRKSSQVDLALHHPLHCSRWHMCMCIVHRDREERKSGKIDVDRWCCCLTIFFMQLIKVVPFRCRFDSFTHVNVAVFTEMCANVSAIVMSRK